MGGISKSIGTSTTAFIHPTEATVVRETEQFDKKGIDRPLAEGPDLTMDNGDKSAHCPPPQRPDWAYTIKGNRGLSPTARDCHPQAGGQ